MLIILEHFCPMVLLHILASLHSRDEIPLSRDYRDAFKAHLKSSVP